MQTIPTQYLVNAARVCVRMPSTGNMWFFVEPSTTVQEFKKLCKSEDTLVSQIDVLDEQGSSNETQPIYDLLEKKQALYLRLNNITYQFATQQVGNGLAITETEPYYKQCMNLGLTSLSSNTIS